MAGQGALLVPSSLPCLCSAYCVQRSQTKPMNRAGAALPALLQFPLVGGEVRVGVGGPRVGCGAQSGAGGWTGVSQAPQEGRGGHCGPRAPSS